MCSNTAAAAAAATETQFKNPLNSANLSLKALGIRPKWRQSPRANFVMFGSPVVRLLVGLSHKTYLQLEQLFELVELMVLQ